MPTSDSLILAHDKRVTRPCGGCVFWGGYDICCRLGFDNYGNRWERWKQVRPEPCNACYTIDEMREKADKWELVSMRPPMIGQMGPIDDTTLID